MSGNTEIVFREALEVDCDELYVLLKNLAEHHCDEGQFKLSLEDLRTAGFSENSFLRGIVAETTDAIGHTNIVGCLLYHFTFEVYRGRGLYVPALMVKPYFRRSGVATALRQALCMIALRNNINRVSFIWSRENRSGMDFLKHLSPKDVSKEEKERHMESHFSNAELQELSGNMETLPVKITV